MEQRTNEWFSERAGKFTGSRFADLMAVNKRTGEPTAAFWDCVWQVVAERISGQPIVSSGGIATRWGADVEPYAREAYEMDSGNLVTEVGFIPHPAFPFAGISPDGLIGEDGGVEFKAPKNEIVHLQRFLDGVPEEYRPQCQGAMWVTGRKWWDFVSYDPRQSTEFQLLRIRINRDEAFIANLQACVLRAEEEASKLIEKLRKSIS